jgi:Holliday junction DNA helicase RuvA
MISTLRGFLRSKSPTEIVLETGGVGYGISIPLSTYEQLGAVGGEIMLFTHLHVREDLLQLFGFASEAEREAFRMLISVTGIGPRMAQGILSGISVPDLRSCLSRGDLSALTTVPGIGRKLAERLVLELREKANRLTPGPTAPGGGIRDQAGAEALLALTSLGYTRQGAEKAVRAALAAMDDRDVTVESLVKASLKFIAR